mgnify:CR=1 FL=1
MDTALLLCGPRDPLLTRVILHPKAKVTWGEAQDLAFVEVMELTVLLDALDEAEREAAANKGG